MGACGNASKDRHDVEVYMGKHGGGGTSSPMLVVRDNNC